MPHEIPSRPWQKLATDLFMWNKRSSLVTVNYYSQFFEVDELTTTTSAAVIRKLSSHFAHHGIQEAVVSDNGPQFAAEEFGAFVASWDFWHVTSSPGYPQSNGQAERTRTSSHMQRSKAAIPTWPCWSMARPQWNGQTTAIHSAICCQTPVTHDCQFH